MSLGRVLSLAGGVAIALLFLWLLLRDTETTALLAAFDGAQPVWVGLGIAAFFAGYAARIARWQRMLALENPSITWVASAGPFFISIAANNLLPFRAGDALRTFAFRRRLGVSAGPVLATLLVERLLDLLTLLAILAGAVLVTGLAVGGLIGIGVAGLVAVAGAALLVLLAPALFEPLPRGLLRLLGRLAPGLASAAQTQVDRVFGVLKHLAGRRAMIPLIGWSALAWGLEGCVFLCAALALPAMAEPLAAVVALPLGTLATLIPSTPGHIGTFDFFTAEAVALFGVPPSVAAAYALLVHAMLWVPPVLAGGLALLIAPPTGATAREES
ncbi:MAG: lysylphosphatidylglycerol synthase transmembrane domain-containing protein [Pikeienuella sp.]